MKRSELKAIIKECVRETLFEEGVLSEMIAEVAYGLARAQNLMVESKPQQVQVENSQSQQKLEDERNEVRRKKLLETKRKMLDAMGDKKMSNVFEGTEPLSKGGNPNQGTQPQGALSGYAPDDSGVDISGLLNLAGGSWKKIK